MRPQPLVFYLLILVQALIGAEKGPTHAFLDLVPMEAFQEAFGHHPDFQTFLARNQPVINDILEVEEAKSDDYYIVYHGANGWRLIFDTLQILHEVVENQNFSPNFLLLRDPKDPALWKSGAGEFLAHYFPSDTPEWAWPIDWGSDATSIRKLVLSVNLSLFGGCLPSTAKWYQGTTGECSSYFWYASFVPGHERDKSQRLREVLTPILTRYGIKKTHVEELLSIHNELTIEDEALLIQILIPKNLLDQVLYLSKMQGRPLFPLGKEYKASEILDLYSTTPTAIPDFTMLQARLVITKEQLLNPQSGIEINTYLPTSASQERIDTYKRKLRHWAKRAVVH